MMLWVCCLLILLVPSFILGQVVTITTIPSSESQPIYVISQEGSVDVSLYCFVIQNGIQVQPLWTVERTIDSSALATDFNSSGDVVMPQMELGGKIRATGEPIPDLVNLTMLTFETNLTILNFTTEFNLVEIKCGASSQFKQFTLGFPVIASLQLSGSVQSVEEGQDIMINLQMGSVTPFPPLITSQWTLDDTPLSNSSSNDKIILTDYTISLTNVQRNQSGNYSLTVSNDAGSATSSFILNVLFATEATPVGGNTLALSDSTVTLIAFTDITSNPAPTVNWTGPDDQLITTGGGRFNTSVDGQLTITGLNQLTDNGTYTCTIGNGIGVALVQSVILTLAVSAGPPTDISGSEVTDTSVRLSWTPPTQLGTPPLSFYRVIMIPAPPPDVILNTTNTSLLVWGIIPGTVYNVTVVAVSMAESIGRLESTPSDLFSFTTLLGAPMFQTVSTTASNGLITVSWTFRHTGGQLIDDVEVLCSIDGEGSGTGLYDMLSCSSDIMGCANDNLMGSTSVGPVSAGESYSCRVTAINDNGTDIRTFTNIVPTEGIPSSPVINSTIINTGEVIFRLSTLSPGDSSTFQFIINITDSTAGSSSQSSFPFPNYMSNSLVSASISLPDGGSFTFTVGTSNQYGQSETAVTIGPLTVDPSPTSATPTVSVTTSVIDSSSSVSVTETSTISTPTSEPTSGGLSGGAIAGIIISLIIVIALLVLVGLVIFYFYYKNKGGSYQVERAGKGVKVEELDIDIGTELKPTQQSGGGAGETEEGSKPELHYADLEHFAKKPRDGPKTEVSSKPLPIEEVQYSEIKPQKAKEESEAAKTPSNII